MAVLTGRRGRSGGGRAGGRGQNTPLGLRIHLCQRGALPPVGGGRALDPGKSLTLGSGGGGTVETERKMNKRKHDG